MLNSKKRGCKHKCFQSTSAVTLFQICFLQLFYLILLRPLQPEKDVSAVELLAFTSSLEAVKILVNQDKF